MIQTIINGTSRLSLNPHGARIEELILDNTLVLGTFTREDKKTESTHPCTLQHGVDRFGMNKHGAGRNIDWTLAHSDFNILATCTIGMVDVIQDVTLDASSFTLKTTHVNRGEDVPTNFAEHNYFATPEGNDDVLFNGELVIQELKKERATSGYDYIVREMQETNTIYIPGKEHDITIKLSQPSSLPFGYVAIWVMGNDIQYLCIEPVVGNPQSKYLQSDESLLKNGETKTVEFSIKID